MNPKVEKVVSEIESIVNTGLDITKVILQKVDPVAVPIVELVQSVVDDIEKILPIDSSNK